MLIITSAKEGNLCEQLNIPPLSVSVNRITQKVVGEFG